MSIKPLDRLLFIQGGQCFFCSAQLPRENATIEHLDARANGGGNSEQNCVACCREINSLLGSMSLKEKIRVVLNQRGRFVCPNKAASASVAPKPRPAVPAAEINSYSIVIADLKRRGVSRPKKVESLKNTVRAVVASAKGSLTETQLDSLLKRLHDNGKIQIVDTTVRYSL